MITKGAEEARNPLSHLLDEAERGQAAVITRRGRPAAAIVPIDAYDGAVRQAPLTPLAGSGRGLWGPDSSAIVSALRDEWSR